jgi:hypothetical protein
LLVEPSKLFFVVLRASDVLYVSPAADPLYQQINNASGAVKSRMWPADRCSDTPS